MPEDQGGKTIMFAHWPKPFDEDFKGHYALDDCYLERMENKYELVRQGRNLRAEARIAANMKVRFVLKPIERSSAARHRGDQDSAQRGAFEVNSEFQPGKGTARALTPLGELFLPTEGLDRSRGGAIAVAKGVGEDPFRDRKGFAEAFNPNLQKVRQKF